MTNLTTHLHSAFSEAYDLIRTGKLKTLIPFLSLFRLNGKPMDLKLHYQLAPMYNTVQPAHSVYMCGRQLGKSYGVCSNLLLRSMLTPYYHTVLIQPRADQIQRMIGTVYKPLLNSCIIADDFISSIERGKLALREFRNGSLCYAEHIYLSPDRVRGISGASTTCFDESVSGCEEVFVASQNDKCTLKKKKISQILPGDVCISFDFSDKDAIVRSLAVKQASFHGIRNCFKITTDSGRTLTCTADHLLPTNKGKMRLSEIINYEFSQNSCTVRNVGTTAQCCDGKSTRGCQSSSIWTGDESTSLESWCMSGRLCESQIPTITRVRHKATVQATESRLRERVVSLNTEKHWNISLLIHAPVSGIRLQEDCYQSLPGSNNTSNSTSMVVHGRWKSYKRSQHRNVTHKQFLLRGAPGPAELASRKMGNRNSAHSCYTQFERKPIMAACSSDLWLPEICVHNSSICSRLHAIQDTTDIQDLSNVRQAIPCYRKSGMLLRELQNEDVKRTQASLPGSAQRGTQNTSSCVEESSQRADKSSSQIALCNYNTRAEKQTCCICCRLESEESGICEGVEKTLSGGAQRRSGISGVCERTAQTILRETKAGSRTFSEKIGEVERAPEIRYVQGKRTRIPETSQSEVSGVTSGNSPGERGQEAGEETYIRTYSTTTQSRTEPEGLRGQEAKDCCHDTRGTGCVSCCRARTFKEQLGQYVRRKTRDNQSTTACHASKLDSGAKSIQGRTETGICIQTKNGTRCDSCRPPEVANQTCRGTEFFRNLERATFFFDPIVSVEYVGEQPVYDIEVTGTHNYILANGICSYNCQDLEYEFLDVAAEVMSASLFWGFSIYTGTPKTTDTTLALLWERSSKAEWVIRCTHCGYFNIPNPEQDLLKMIGKTGPICAKCGKPVYPKDGGYVHALPDRDRKFPGYHISQTIHPLHMLNINKWTKLLDKVENYSTLTLYNEVFGWPYDAATSPLTLSDLQNATFTPMDEDNIPVEITKPEDVKKVASNYRYLSVAVDWSGGGMISDSYTSYAVLGLRSDSDVIDVLYGKRIPKGVSPTDEANEILYWIRGACADSFVYDNGGAGFARLEIMNHQGLRNIQNLTIVPINYVRPHSGDVMQPHTGQRESDLYYYTLDKSRSLAICLMSIKSNRLRFIKFDTEDDKAYQRDFLALREDPRQSLGNETVILIIKKPGVPDDFAHAVNFGCSQIWDHFGAYPRIGARYDASILDYDENHSRILSDETFGPRGDFERFASAVESKAAVITPDEYF